ncbi:MAG: hypothetical protein OHK0056_26560 [Bacteriovoracaceae bacterium]
MNFLKFVLIIWTLIGTSWALIPKNSPKLGTELKIFLKEKKDLKKIDATTYSEKIGDETYTYYFSKMKLAEITIENVNQKNTLEWMKDKKFVLRRLSRSTDQPAQDFLLIEVQSGLEITCEFPLKIKKVSKKGKKIEITQSKSLQEVLNELTSPEVIKK